MSGNAGVDCDGEFYPIDPSLPLDHIHEDEEDQLSPCCGEDITQEGLCSDCYEHCI